MGGTRPNFIKLAPLYHQLTKEDSLSIEICHTGQHYDWNMSGAFFEMLDIPQAHHFLGSQGTSVSTVIGDTISRLDPVIQKGKYDLVIVFGDVNATIAGAIVAGHNHIQVMHVEAGLRSFDRTMPEEINRVLTDHISDHLMVSEQSGIDNLMNEGISTDKIHFVGNLMIECLLMFQDNWRHIVLDWELEKKIKDKEFFLSTFHRPENVDNPKALKKVIDILGSIPDSKLIILPLHPRTHGRLEEFGLMENLHQIDNLIVTSPMSYFEFLHLVSRSQMVITDSGGIQEETSFLNVPCLTFRKNTERPITIHSGTNRLMDINNPDSLEALNSLAVSKSHADLPFWDNEVSQRIIKVIKSSI
ncbi:MAG: UDP-N-acetylglucosamine 2-epimerase (non-hydrolyzing) [Cyclobacteriaceae bacterium]